MDDERKLLERWGQGDRKAGAVLFDRYYEQVARFFHNKVHESASLDLIQGTFLACVEGRERFRGDGDFRSYLFAIAHHQLCKHYRTQRRGDEAVDLDEVSVADLSPSMSKALAQRQEQRLLLEALRQVPLDCQVVLELHYWEQLSTAEIGKIVDRPEGTVKSRLQRGRRLLKEKLERLAHSRELLESTLTDLDKWARDLRNQVGGNSAEPASAREE